MRGSPACDLRDHRDARARGGVHRDREIRDAEEERDRDRAHRDERERGVPALGATKRADAVRDRLDAGQRRGARRERLQDDEDADAPAPAASGFGTPACGHVPSRHLPTPVPIMRNMAATKPYVGSAKRTPDSRTPRRFTIVSSTTNASESPTLCGVERGSRRGQREHTRCDRHCDGQDVVDEERSGGDEARERAEVVLRDDVGAAARLVRPDRLRVREDDDREHDRDRDRDREHETERRRRRRRRGRPSLPRSHSNRRQRVRREDRKRERLRDQCLVHLAGGPRAPDERRASRRRGPRAASSWVLGALVSSVVVLSGRAPSAAKVALWRYRPSRAASRNLEGFLGPARILRR